VPFQKSHDAHPDAGRGSASPPATTVESLYGVKGLYKPKLIRVCGLRCTASKPRANV